MTRFSTARSLSIPLLLASCALSAALKPATARASGFGCAGVAGKVLFLDTLYGTATGVVVGGVVELIREDHDGWQRRLATGAAIGAGLGLVLGGLEIGLRDCSEPTRAKETRVEPRWKAPSFVFVPPGAKGDGGAAGLRFSVATP